MVDISHSIFINCPVEQVFNFVTNFENDKKWWESVSHTEKLTPGPMAVGTDFRQVAKVMFLTVHNHLRVVEWQPPTLARYINTSPQLAYTLSYTFTPVSNSSTRFALNAQLEPKGLLKWLLPITMSALKGQLERYFNKLKTVVETEYQSQQA